MTGSSERQLTGTGRFGALADLHNRMRLARTNHSTTPARGQCLNSRCCIAISTSLCGGRWLLSAKPQCATLPLTLPHPRKVALPQLLAYKASPDVPAAVPHPPLRLSLLPFRLPFISPSIALLSFTVHHVCLTPLPQRSTCQLYAAGTLFSTRTTEQRA